MTEKFEIDYHGLVVKGTIVSGDWEGDPSIPNGKHELPPYIESFIVEAPDGVDISGQFTDDFLSYVEDEAIYQVGALPAL